RHAPRTRPDAVAAADARVRVVGDGPVWPSIESRRRTGRHARGLEAVQAAPHRVRGEQSAGRVRVGELLVGGPRKGLRAEHGRVLEAELGLELGRLAVAVVPLLARDLAGVAPDALRDVDQRRLDLLGLGRRRHVLRPRGWILAATRSDTLTTFTRHALV